MAHNVRLTKEELDQQFEQFLKESVSDDSFELGSSNKKPTVLNSLGKPPVRPVKKKQVSVPWWQNDDDDDDDGSEEGTEKSIKQRFTKARESQVVNPQVENKEGENASLVPCKPTPKPRSKALDRVNQFLNQKSSDSACRQRSPDHNALEENMPSEEQRVSEDDPGRAADNSSSTSEERSLIHNHSSNEVSVENNDEESIEKGHGMSSSGKSFLKSLRNTPSIKEVDEEQPKAPILENEDIRDPVIFSRDSLEPEDIVMASRPGTRVGFLGLDTSDEEEKTRFLSNVKSSSSIDFSRPDQEREVSTPTFLQREKEMDATTEEEQKIHERTASPAYSEDFEGECSEKSDEEPQEKVSSVFQKPDGRGMLAKVSLHDSLNSTDGALHLPVAVESPEKERRPEKPAVEPAVQSYGQSEGSEIEALQEAYRQISDSVGVCEERREGGSGTPLSPSTLQPASTTESDLPTAEELMRPIGPDSGFTRGFSLQPIIEAAAQDSDSHNPLRVSSDMSPFSSANDCSGAAYTTDGIIGGEHQGSFHHTQKSIAEEIKRLLQEQEAPSPPKPKKRQVPARSSVSAHLSAPSRKAPAPSLKSKKSESRPLPKAPALVRINQSSKPPSHLTQRKAQSQAFKKPQILNQTNTVKGLDTSLRLSNELVASVQSFATFLQHQAQANNLQDKSPHQTDTITPKAKTDRRVVEDEIESDLTSNPERLHLQSAQKESELHLRKEQLRQEHERERAALCKEIYMLQSKLHSAEEAGKKQKWSFGEASDPVTEEKLKLIEKEMKEQETLIQGYHQENEKLYLQMKALQAHSRQNEETLFLENQRLLTELAHTRDRLNKSNVQRSVGVKSIADQSFNIAEVTTQVQAAQRSEERLLEEIRRLKQEKQALHVDLEMMRKERDLAKARAVYTSGDKSFELRMLQEKHRDEVTELKKRLQWYAENQELLDKDAVRLRTATAETQRLTEQVEKLKTEVNRRANEQQRKVKERAGEAKRVQELERQLKQMEDLLKSRHPNSLPALIFAAASAGEKEAGAEVHPPSGPPSSQTAALLERRVHRLEAELEGRDDAAKRSLRTMEQQYHRIKLQYEQQITDLEQRLAERSQTNPKATSEESQSQIEALKAELAEIKTTRHNRENDLQGEVASLKEQLQQAEASSGVDKPVRSPSRHQLHTEAAQASRIERLTLEMNAKSRTIQDLGRTLDRLQRERRTMLSAPGFSRTAGEHRRQSGTAKEAKKAAAETFPPTQDEKDYHPGAFAGSHISEVQLENDILRARSEELEAQREEERVSLHAEVKRARAQLSRTREQNAEQLASVKAEHHREIERLLASHALEHSLSKVAELANQVNTQEIVVQHLQAQVKELQGAKDGLAMSKIREETLQNQLSKLLEELKQAKEAHRPELRHFASLEQKIQSMELRYSQREKQLQQVIADTRRVVEQEQLGEVDRWRRIAQGRAKELEAFRLELDSILDVLRELQRQGVVIPTPEHTSTSAYACLPLRS